MRRSTSSSGSVITWLETLLSPAEPFEPSDWRRPPRRDWRAERTSGVAESRSSMMVRVASSRTGTIIMRAEPKVIRSSSMAEPTVAEATTMRRTVLAMSVAVARSKAPRSLAW